MDLLPRLFHRPEFILPVLAVHADLALSLLVWHFDALVSFLVAFAFAYGAVSLCEKLFLPPAPRWGARPRVWRVPLVFGAVALGFPLFLDAFVSDVVRNLLDALSLVPPQWAMRTVACAWAAGAAVVLFRTAGGFLRLAKAAKRLPCCDSAPLREIMRNALADAGVTGNVALRAGPPGTPILSCGVFRPCIVIPENFAERYTPEERYAILLHECVHIRHHDAPALFCAAFAGAVLWFDPVARHALRRMRTDRELFCDWTVLNVHRVPPAFYANLIVSAASEQQRFAPGFSDAYRFVAHRLSRILCDRDIQPPPRVSRRGAALILAGLAACVLAAALFRAHLDPEPPFDPATLPPRTVRHAHRNGVFSCYFFTLSSDRL